MNRRFEGRNVFVTGAGSGFGRRTAELFAAEGAKNLYLLDYKQERLDSVAPVIEELGATPHLLNTDLGVMENCAEAVAQALAIDPKLDVMVSNAAAWTSAEFVDMTDEEWRRVLSVNLDAYFVMGSRAARAMKETGGGVILFTSSIASLGPWSGLHALLRGQGRRGRTNEGHRGGVRTLQHPMQQRRPGPGRHPAVDRHCG